MILLQGSITLRCAKAKRFPGVELGMDLNGLADALLIGTPRL
jgi:hypothetical protein